MACHVVVGWLVLIHYYNGKQSGNSGYVAGGGASEYTMDVVTATVGAELGNPVTTLTVCVVPVTT